MPENKLIVVGGGGFAKEVIWLAGETTHPWQVVGCLNDAEDAKGGELLGVPVLGPVADWVKYQECSFVIAVGAPRTRKLIFDRMVASGAPRFATLVHRSVAMSSSVQVGEGTVITAGCILTVDIEVGRHVILNLNTTVGHETVLGDFTTVAPIVAISGNVTTGKGVELGTSAALRQGVSIGAGSMVGMGAVVTKNVEENFAVVGNPAKPLKQLPPFAE